MKAVLGSKYSPPAKHIYFVKTQPFDYCNLVNYLAAILICWKLSPVILLFEQYYVMF